MINWFHALEMQSEIGEMIPNGSYNDAAAFHMFLFVGVISFIFSRKSSKENTNSSESTSQEIPSTFL
jgi:hypothetical protein